MPTIDHTKPFLTRRFMQRFLAAQQAVPAPLPSGWTAPPTERPAFPRETFDAYVRLKHAVRRGDVPQARRLRDRLRHDPHYGRLAENQLERAYIRAALKRARRNGGCVRPCRGCKTLIGLSAGERVRCPSCARSVAGPTRIAQPV